MTRPWLPGQRVGPYRLEELVGQGGFGQVWRAFDTKRRRDVAIKVLTFDPDATAAQRTRDRDRFLFEAEETSKLEGGPNIIPIYDWDEHDGRPYLVMPFVAGLTLTRLLHDGPLLPARAVEIVVQMADALEYAHSHGRVHRDVKPSNVLVRRVGPRDYVRMVDFGIVGLMDGRARNRLTLTGTVLGSLAYMAPERMPIGPDAGRSPTPDPRVDVYGLACVLHECLTGEPAFGADDGEYPSYVRAHHASRRPRPGDRGDPLLAVFDHVVVRGLAVAVPARTSTVAQFRAEMQEALRTWTALSERPTARTAVRAPASTTVGRGETGGLRTAPAVRAEAEPVDAPSQRAEPVDAPSQHVEPVDAPSQRVEPVDAPSQHVEPVDAPSVEAEPALIPATAVPPVPAVPPAVDPPAAGPPGPDHDPSSGPVEPAEPARPEGSPPRTALSVGALTGVAGCVVAALTGFGPALDAVLIAASWAAGASAGWWAGARRT